MVEAIKKHVNNAVNLNKLWLMSEPAFDAD